MSVTRIACTTLACAVLLLWAGKGALGMDIVTDAVKPGVNVVSVRCDHSSITELFLGGIIRPVLLIDRP